MVEINTSKYFLLPCALQLLAIVQPGLLESHPTEVIEGDMIIPATGLQKRAGIIGDRWRWTHGVIPYTISSKYSPSQVDLIQKSMAELSEKTCIKFTRKENEVDYVAIEPGEGCSSNVGKRGGKQKVTLERASHCMTHGTVIHEFVHALGFVHEHERTDRDDYIKILKNNINPEFHDQFEKYSNNEIHDLGLPYDYDSIMHYTDIAGRKGKNLKTIVPHKSGTSIGQRDGLSKMDVLKINRMYCPKTEVKEVTDLRSLGLLPWEIASLFQQKYGTWSPTAEIKRKLSIA